MEDRRRDAGKPDELDDPAERAERELGRSEEAQRDPTMLEAAEEHRRRPGDDAWSDDDMVEGARG